MMHASHTQPGFLAALLHRLSGLALAIFLPIHFVALATVLRGADALDSFLTVTNRPVVKFAEFAIVTALVVHMTLGLRVLAIEFLPIRERTAATISVCLGAALGVGLLFLLNLRS
jgi:fumarate reductase subunit D